MYNIYGDYIMQEYNLIDIENLVQNLYNKFNLKIFGGCCGTDNTHIEEIARRLNQVI